MLVPTPDTLRSLFEAAARCVPEEACGLVVQEATGQQVYALPNLHPDPTSAFLFDTGVYLGLVGDALTHGRPALLWHSHPTTRPVPSREDQELLRLLRLPFLIVGVRVPVAYLYCLDGEIVRECAQYCRVSLVPV